MAQNEQLTSKEQSEKRSRVSRIVSKIVGLRKRGSVVYEDASLDEILDGPRPVQEETPAPAIELPAITKVTSSGLPTRSLKPASDTKVESAFAGAGTLPMKPILPEAVNENINRDRTLQENSNRYGREDIILAKVYEIAAAREARQNDPWNPNRYVGKHLPTPSEAPTKAFMADPLGAPKEIVPWTESVIHDEMIDTQRKQAIQAHNNSAN